MIAVATLTAMLGVMTTAFLIAVLSQKLLLSRWEKYIYNFVLNIELAKVHKYHAANVILYGWRVWKLTKLGKQRTMQYASAQRNFYQAINHVHEVRNARRNFTDNILGFAEVMMVQRETLTKSGAMESQVEMITQKINSIEETLKGMSNAIQLIERKLKREVD